MNTSKGLWPVATIVAQTNVPMHKKDKRLHYCGQLEQPSKYQQLLTYAQPKGNDFPEIQVPEKRCDNSINANPTHVARSKMKKKNETCHVNSIQIRQNHNKNNQRKKKKKVDILSLTCTFASPEATSAPHNFESFFP
uniref:Uncharacterized protein n=1 Tax=Cucumis melo TaxID=3656 RepID=A0A9I9EGN5_CUCME